MATKAPEIITDRIQMRKWTRAMRSQGKTVALVPTMGYLHEGHLSLVRDARNYAGVTVVSIYLNPSQFSPTEDLSAYPTDFDGDVLKLKSVGADAVFHPENLYDYGGEIGNGNIENGGARVRARARDMSFLEEMGNVHETWIRVEKLEKVLCGKTRPVHFRGAATVVAKLFNIVEPDVAVFGKKDYQQWRVIQRMVRDLDFGIDVVGSEIVRDNDGLALSSRNVRLLPEERQKALSISQSLRRAKASAEESGNVNCKEIIDSAIQEITEAGGKIDYAEIVDQTTLEAVEEIKSLVVFCIAAWFGNVRLIDNMEIST